MDEFDVLVIGAGSAGCAVAGRLAEDPALSVCLFEAGGTNTSLLVTTPGLLAINLRKTPSNWAYETVPQRGLLGRRGYQPRGRGLGGSSAINAMLYLRGNPYDYDNWAALGCTGWSWADVLPWFRRSEGNTRGADPYHGAEGPLAVTDQLWPNPASKAWIEAAAGLQLGRNEDFNGMAQDGFGLHQVTQKDGERWSTARAFLAPRANLAVRKGAAVTRIVFEQGRATGVALRVPGGGERIVRARGGVVLSGGTFASPQLLMLSGVGPAEHLRSQGIDVLHDIPEVGANLQDHVDFVANWTTRSHEPIGFAPAGLWRLARAFIEHRRRRTGILTSPMAEAGGFWRSEPDLPAPDLQFHFVPAVLEDHGRKLTMDWGISCHACVLRPDSRGTLRLASRDPAAAPAIDPNFFANPADLAVMRKGVRLMHRIAASPPLAELGLTDRHPVDLANDDALDHLIRSRADTIYHPVGTCRMGGDAHSVVDPQLRLRGMERLWVADASVMPQIVSGNTNAPTIMIGERAAAFVAESLRT
jgi:choline dehydrogenase-like flavoprotein